MAVSRKAFGESAEMILEGGAKKVTVYFTDKQTLVATRRGKRDKRSQTTILFTIGRPNYAGRQFIKKRKADGARFPFRHIKYDKR